MNIESLKRDHQDHWLKATALRMLAIDSVQNANSGHPGMPMGMADVATVLFQSHLKFDSSCPDWPDRDRFILSAGHGSMLLYALLHLTGYEDMKIEDLQKFRQLHSKTAGHPEHGYASGIEITTGPLGQGLASAVGFAIAEAALSKKWGANIFNHRTYVVAGDGCLMEGISQEAIALAGKQKLEKLIVLWDDNKITIDGELSRSCITDQEKRFSASGWEVLSCDGHNPDSINAALTRAKKSSSPSLIKCSTHIGFGSPSKQDSAAAHGSPLGLDEIEKVRQIYEWNYPPFSIPAAISDSWLQIGTQGKSERIRWQDSFSKMSLKRKKEFSRINNLETPKSLDRKIRAFKQSISETRPVLATRKSSELALSLINDVMNETIGGSADLTGSNNTLTKGMNTFDEQNRSGRYIYYGVREHGMAAAMNGIALHGGILPYGGTFMAFTDYARGAIRLSALMKLRVVYVMTHDSIGLGEDGPTHQPVEHLAMLRATPNILVFRPADTIETIECWEIAVKTKTSPSVLALSRQNLPTVRTDHSSKNLCSKGAYVLAKAVARRKAVIIASGSEVEIAIEAQKKLEGEGIGTQVVSMPCWDLFAQQTDSYKRKVLPSNSIRVGVEAGVSFGWDKWLSGERGSSKKSAFIGMESFGASGPAKNLYDNFNINVETVISKIKSLL